MYELELNRIDGQSYKVLSGVDLGKKARNSFKIDMLDMNSDPICVIIPDEVYCVNSSFFSGLFHKSIHKLKERKFRDKYVFQCSTIIRKNIEDGIFYVLNTKNLLED